MARPKIDIDIKQFEKLCGLQCTLKEIAGYFSCSEDTIERWCQREYKANFAEVFRQKRVTGLISLRRSQFRLAEANPSLSIWLGKQYLGQSEPKQEVVLSTDDDKTIQEMENYFNSRKNNEHS